MVPRNLPCYSLMNSRKSALLSLLLLAAIAFSGCAWLPKKGASTPGKTKAQEQKVAPASHQKPQAVSAPSLTPSPTPALSPTPATSRSWKDRIFFWRSKPQPAAPASQYTPIPGLATKPPPPVPRLQKSLFQKLFFWWPKGKPKPPVAQPLMALASIYVVNIPSKFVVLESVTSPADMHEGKLLSTISAGVIQSTVRITAESRPPFIIAEIISGTPERGAQVFAVE